MVDKFRFYCQKILPLVYDESLSYYETLCKISNKLNEVIEEVNTTGESILEQAREYTDKAISENQTFIIEKISEVNGLIEQVNYENQLFKDNINAQIKILNGYFNNFKDDVEREVSGAKDYTDFAILNMYNRILDDVSKGLSNLRVVNYFTGGETTIQNMFDTLAVLHVENPLTYDDLALLNLTYTELYNKSITYTQFVMQGKELLSIQGGK